METKEQVEKILKYEKEKYTDYYIHEYKTGDRMEIYRDSETGFLNVTIIPVKELDYSSRLEFPFLSYANGNRCRTNIRGRKTLSFNTARLNSISPYLYDEQKKVLGLHNFNKIRYITIEDTIYLGKRILAKYYKEGGLFRSGRRKSQKI